MTLTLEQKKAKHYAVKGCGGVQLHVKDVDTVGRTVTGFYNTLNYFDSDFDVIVSGATKKSISERGPLSSATAKIKHALQHDLTQLPGKIKVLEEKTFNGYSGIYFETKMSDTTLGNDTLKNYLEGIYDNHSIGFQYLQLEAVDADSKAWQSTLNMLVNPKDAEAVGLLYLVKEIALFEGSTVAFGANQLTPFLGVKSGNKDSLRIALNSQIDKLVKAVKSGTQSDEILQSFELQTYQLKQMVNELTEVVTIPKSTPTEPPVEVKQSVNYEYLKTNLKIS
jgi:HK97 family phage prohead protease